MSHTPGPWNATPHGSVRDPNGLSIAMADDYGKSQEERAANARLIAAAPALLEALERSLKWLAASESAQETGAYAQAIAAIAAASKEAV